MLIFILQAIIIISHEVSQGAFDNLKGLVQNDVSFIFSRGAKLPLTLGAEEQLFQVEVQFPGERII